MKKNQILSRAALLSTSAAMLAGCSDKADTFVDPKPNADGKYNIIFITTDQESYMEDYPQGSDYAARERLRQIGTSFEKHYACSNVSTSINTAASRYDGKHTMHFCLVTFLFSWLTFGILPLVWFSKISTRIGNELTRRGINYSFSAKHFWLWGFLGSIIIAGPFIYYHRLLTAMNLICEDYNRVG